MSSVRTAVFVVFLFLLASSLVVSHAERISAESYAALPASADETTPLATGNRAPAFTVRTVDNQPYAFDPENLERPTILISFRGGWCPYCNMHLNELRHVIPELKQRGFDVLFLSNDDPKLLYSSLETETRETIDGLDYLILSDAGLDAALAFGTAFRTDKRLTDYLERKDRDYAGSSIGLHNALAVPAVYVVSQSGDIVFDYVNANYKIRLSADDLLAAAKGLSQ